VEKLPDGRSNILVLGQERFRVQGFRYDQPYLVGQVQPFPMPGSLSKAALRRVEGIRQGLREYLIALEAGSGQHLNIQGVPDEADSLAYLVAIALQVEPEVKQKLLEATSVAEMLWLERRLLETETAIMRYMERTRPLADAAGPATPN
jgi:Lon protease-like protein